MKPIYQGCMEKGIQHVATHAAEAAVGGGSRTSLNGKVKSSWEYANLQKPNNDASGYIKPKATNDKGASTTTQQQKMVVNNIKQTTTGTGTSTNNNYLGQKLKPQPLENTSTISSSLNAASSTTIFASIWSKFSATCNEAKQQKILQKQASTSTTTAAASTSSNGNANSNNVTTTNRKKRKSKKNSNSSSNVAK